MYCTNRIVIHPLRISPPGWSIKNTPRGPQAHEFYFRSFGPLYRSPFFVRPLGLGAQYSLLARVVPGLIPTSALFTTMREVPEGQAGCSTTEPQKSPPHGRFFGHASRLFPALCSSRLGFEPQSPPRWTPSGIRPRMLFLGGHQPTRSACDRVELETRKTCKLLRWVYRLRLHRFVPTALLISPIILALPDFYAPATIVALPTPTAPPVNASSLKLRQLLRWVSPILAAPN